MTNQTASAASVLRAVALAAAILVVFALTGSIASAKEQAAPQPVTPQPVALASNSLAALEEIFWACDYAGTNGAVDAGTGIACIELTRELTMKKFNGDFEAMVAWWQQHKPAQHRALHAAAQRR
jgi:hypothetical protein